MQYHPELFVKEIEDNHRRFSQRVLLCREKGPDFVKSRRFMLEKAFILVCAD